MEDKNTKMKNSVVLLSGGIDSAACIPFLKSINFNVTGLFINYGQSSYKYELNAAKRISEFYDVPLVARDVVVNPKSEFSIGEIRGRNAFLIFTALMYSDIRVGSITLGIHAGTNYYDCSKAFLLKINDIVKGYTDGKVNVHWPFVDWDKGEIFAYCKEINLPLSLTYSCEKGEGEPCGLCASCLDREKLNVC